MKAIPVAAVVMVCLSAFGCSKDEGNAFADEVCACKDKDCVDKAFKAYEDKLPALKAKLSEVDKLPEEQKKPIERAFGCMAKVAE